MDPVSYEELENNKAFGNNPRRTEANDLHEFTRYLHELGLTGNVKKTSLGYHAQIEKSLIIDPLKFSSVEDNHVMLAFADLKNTSIVGDFVFDVTETKETTS